MTLGFAYEESRLRSKYLGRMPAHRGNLSHWVRDGSEEGSGMDPGETHTALQLHAPPHPRPVRAYTSIKHSSTVKQILINAYYLRGGVSSLLPSKATGLVVLWLSAIGVTLALGSLIYYHGFLILNGYTTIEHFNAVGLEHRMK